MIGKNFFDFMLDKGNFVNPKTKTLTSIRLIGLNTTIRTFSIFNHNHKMYFWPAYIRHPLNWEYMGPFNLMSEKFILDHISHALFILNI